MSLQYYGHSFVYLLMGSGYIFSFNNWRYFILGNNKLAILEKKRKEKKKPKSEIKSWFNAIIFAVIAATILRTFLIEAYTIPTSSMENHLLIGDFLFVSKISYGPRVPNTPISFPLVHHTLPLTKSTPAYLKWIKLNYHRMKGFR